MLGAQHSQNLDPLLTNIAGLKVISIATPYDAKGLLKSAIRDNNPVIVLESEMLYGFKGPVPEEEYLIPLGQGDLKKQGSQITLISWGKILHKVLEIAEQLETENISAEVIDPRTLKPLDEELIFSSIKKTNRCVIIEENWPFSSVGSQISDRIQSECFDYLDAPIKRVSQEEVPVPYNEQLEHQALPNKEKIITAIKETCYQL